MPPKYNVRKNSNFCLLLFCENDIVPKSYIPSSRVVICLYSTCDHCATLPRFEDHPPNFPFTQIRGHGARSATRPVWQGVSMDSLKFHSGPPCPTLLRLAGGTPPKQLYGRFWGGEPACRRAGGLRLSSTPLDTPRRTGLSATAKYAWHCSKQRRLHPSNHKSSQRSKSCERSDRPSSKYAGRRVWVATYRLHVHFILI
jgi:hypothetical protein